MRSSKTIVITLIALFFTYIACNTSNTSEKLSQNNGVSSEMQILNPFADNNGIYPPPDVYKGPFFKANYDYPTSVPEKTYPWESVLNGQPLTKANATEYIMAVREYIADDMRLMIDQPDAWLESSNKKNWYNMGWSGQSYKETEYDGLETVYGTLTGQIVKNDVFADYGFEGPMQNHALVYYSDIAALTLNNLWKSKSPSGFFPNYTTEAAQFKQNAIVIKAAGATPTGEEWPVLEGSGTFHVYRPLPFGPNKTKKPILQELTWIQFDIIIKDTIASPETGWVFSTFIYDSTSPGKTTFERLELLGVYWGNDPGKMNGTEVLEETYINPNAPAYSQATMGYGGRLAGPIDIALVGGIEADGTPDSVFVLNKYDGADGGNKYLHFTASACLSCHGTASWPWQNDFYPSPGHHLVFSDTLYNPQSTGWSNYYQNRNGTEIMPNLMGYDTSTMALDYDLFMQFALNNSLLGQQNLPANLEVPNGYKLRDTKKHGPQKKPRSK